MTLALGGVGYAYWRNEYGGFSGIYKPTDLVEALNKEDNIIVVDIRSEEEQEKNGVLDLRRAARGKAVSLPIVEVGCCDLPTLRICQIIQCAIEYRIHFE